VPERIQQEQLFRIISPMLFMLCGTVKDECHTRSIARLGGLAQSHPRLALFIVFAFMASLGLPGLAGFVAEILVFIGIFRTFGAWILFPILAVVITGAYHVWALQRTVFGPMSRTVGRLERNESVVRWERIPLLVLMLLIAVLGVFPWLVLDVVDGWLTPLFEGIAPVLAQEGI